MDANSCISCNFISGEGNHLAAICAIPVAGNLESHIAGVILGKCKGIIGNCDNGFGVADLLRFRARNQIDTASAGIDGTASDLIGNRSVIKCSFSYIQSKGILACCTLIKLTVLEGVLCHIAGINFIYLQGGRSLIKGAIDELDFDGILELSGSIDSAAVHDNLFQQSHIAAAICQFTKVDTGDGYSLDPRNGAAGRTAGSCGIICPIAHFIGVISVCYMTSVCIISTIFRFGNGV